MSERGVLFDDLRVGDAYERHGEHGPEARIIMEIRDKAGWGRHAMLRWAYWISNAFPGIGSWWVKEKTWNKWAQGARRVREGAR